MESITTVFVDLDDTIWWFSQNSLASLRHVYGLYGLRQWCDYATFDQHYHYINSLLWEQYHYGQIEKGYLVRERFSYALEHSHCPAAVVARSGEINHEYLRFLALQPLTVPGARETLQYLAGRYQVNVLSNGFKEVQRQKLVSAGIDQYISHIVLSDDCGITKPLRGIFDYALQRCNASAATSVMIGDNYQTDICGAHDAGWHTIFFNIRGEQGAFPKADATISQLPELKGIL